MTRWTLQDRIFVWQDGAPVSGLVPARMTEPVRTLVGAAPETLAALRGLAWIVGRALNPEMGAAPCDLRRHLEAAEAAIKQAGASMASPFKPLGEG